jgi:DNA-binding MarR family transcriptional regulator
MTIQLITGKIMERNGEESAIQWIADIDVPAALISYSYRTIQKAFARELADYGLGWGHFAILAAVYEAEGRSQDGLALSRGFDKTMIAKSVVRMEEEGLICRKVDRKDKRVKRLYLTDKGRSLRQEMLRIGYRINTLLFTGLEPDEAEQAMKILRKIAINAAGL